jgi:hypothetical protein
MSGVFSAGKILHKTMHKEPKTAPIRENHLETRKIPAYFSLRY